MGLLLALLSTPWAVQPREVAGGASDLEADLQRLRPERAWELIDSQVVAGLPRFEPSLNANDLASGSNEVQATLLREALIMFADAGEPFDDGYDTVGIGGSLYARLITAREQYRIGDYAGAFFQWWGTTQVLCSDVRLAPTDLEFEIRPQLMREMVWAGERADRVDQTAMATLRLLGQSTSSCSEQLANEAFMEVELRSVAIEQALDWVQSGEPEDLDRSLSLFALYARLFARSDWSLRMKVAWAHVERQAGREQHAQMIEAATELQGVP